jgi:hypothetical protein
MLSVLLSLAIGTAAATTTLWLHIRSRLALFYVTAQAARSRSPPVSFAVESGDSGEPLPSRERRERDQHDRLSVARLQGRLI